MVEIIERPFASSMERRLNLRLLAYWEKLRAGQVMPDESQFRPDDVMDMWNSCFMLHTARFLEPGYHCSYLGDDINRAWKLALGVGDPAETLLSPKAPELAAIYNQMGKTPRPVVDEGEYLTPGKHVLRFRRCFLPLGENGRVSAIFGGIRFKVF